MTPEQIDSLAAECIAEDWDDHIPGYYRNMNLTQFAVGIRTATLKEAAAAILAAAEGAPKP